MIARVVVGVAAQDIEDEAAEQLAQGLARPREAVADDLGQLRIAGVARHHLVEAEQGQRRDHRLALPAVVECVRSKRSTSSTSLPATCSSRTGAASRPSPARQPHGHELRLHHVVGIVGRRELGDQLMTRRRRSCAFGRAPPMRAAMEQRLVEFGIEWLAFARLSRRHAGVPPATPPGLARGT